MRKMKGEWIFTAADTFSLDMVLSPIIAAGLKKFLEVVKDHPYAGVSNKFIMENGLDTHTEEDMVKAVALWREAIEKMVYAFEAEEPEYSYGFVDGPDHGKKIDHNCTIWDKIPDNPEAWELYTKQMKEHNEKQAEGHLLFGKYYTGLWW